LPSKYEIRHSRFEFSQIDFQLAQASE